MRLKIECMKLENAEARIKELEVLISKKEKALKSWSDWFAAGGDEDLASPVSGREIMRYACQDIPEFKAKIEEIRHQANQVRKGQTITWLHEPA